MNHNMNSLSHRMCHGKITEEEYLTHMIPHHQMAIDMSKQILKYSNNPAILKLARDVVWAQNYEIWLMTSLLKGYKYESNLLRNKPWNHPIGNNPILAKYSPNTSEDLKTKGECDMKFMKPCKK